MDLIKLFLLGVGGYLLLGLFDLAQIHHKRWLSRFLSIGFLVSALPYALLLVRFSSPHPLPLLIPLSLLTAAAALATLYVAVLEIPLRHKDSEGVYSQGSYARVRHPGFLAHLVFNLLFSLTLFDGAVACLCLLFVSCNLILVTVEDRVLFPTLFADYEHYKQTTNFLIPRRRGHR